MEHIATFAESPDGKLYRDVCERFRVDPAAPLEDDVMAYQLRIALAVSHQEQPAEDADPYETARRAAAQVKAAIT